MKKELNWSRIVIAALLVLAAVVSFFPIAGAASSTEVNSDLIASIDSKVETVMKLTATSTVASAAVSAIPSDTATPIAEKLADLTSDFLAILCVLYSEKYLLTIIGLAVFKVAIPVACALGLVSVAGGPSELGRLAFKLLLLSLCLYFAIPGSIRLADTIYATYEDSINETIEETESFSDTTSALSEAEDDQSLLDSILNSISETATGLADKAASILSRFVETVAILIVTNCILPVLGLLFFVWLINMFTGVDLFSVPMRRAPVHGFLKPVRAPHPDRGAEPEAPEE